MYIHIYRKRREAEERKKREVSNMYICMYVCIYTYIGRGERRKGAERRK